MVDLAYNYTPQRNKDVWSLVITDGVGNERQWRGAYHSHYIFTMVIAGSVISFKINHPWVKRLIFFSAPSLVAAFHFYLSDVIVKWVVLPFAKLALHGI